MREQLAFARHDQRVSLIADLNPIDHPPHRIQVQAADEPAPAVALHETHRDDGGGKTPPANWIAWAAYGLNDTDSVSAVRSAKSNVCAVRACTTSTRQFAECAKGIAKAARNSHAAYTSSTANPLAGPPGTRRRGHRLPHLER